MADLELPLLAMPKLLVAVTSGTRPSPTSPAPNIRAGSRKTPARHGRGARTGSSIPAWACRRARHVVERAQLGKDARDLERPERGRAPTALQTGIAV
jgi:hypothetical protein